MKTLKKLLLLPALTLPLTAGTCTDSKDVDLVLGVPAEFPVDFHSTGGVNVHDDEGTVDLRDLGLEGELDDADLDPQKVEEISIVKIFYRITQPQAGRSIENGELRVERGSGLGGDFVSDGNEGLLVTGFSADAGAATEWIDISAQLQPGVNILNDLTADLLTEIQGGASATNTVIHYEVSGNSVPAAETTDIKWAIKLVIQIVGGREFEVPFG